VPKDANRARSRSAPRLSLRQVAALLRQDRVFATYLGASLVLRTGMALTVSVMPVYQVRTLGASDAWIGALLTVQRVIQMVAFMALSGLLRQRRYRRWLWLSTLGIAAVPLTTAMAVSPAMLLIPSVLGGVFAAGMTVYLTNTLLAASPDENRPLYAALNASVIQVTTFAAPMAGSLLADLVNIRLVLLLATLVRLAGGVAFGRRRSRLRNERAGT